METEYDKHSKVADPQFVDPLTGDLQALMGEQAPGPGFPQGDEADASDALHFLGAQWKNIRDGNLIDALGGHDRGVGGRIPMTGGRRICHVERDCKSKGKI